MDENKEVNIDESKKKGGHSYGYCPLLHRTSAKIYVSDKPRALQRQRQTG